MSKVDVNEKVDMVRMNIYLPGTFKAWLAAESIKTGMTQTSLVVLALKTYMDQQKTMDMMPKMLEVLEDLKAVGVDPEKLKKAMEIKENM